MKQSPVQFLSLVFVLSLPFWLLGIFAPNSLLPYGLPISAIMTVCPMLAALILTSRQDGRQAAKRLFARVFDIRWIKDKHWLLLSVLIMPLVMLVSWFLMQYLGYPLPTPHIALVTIPMMLLVYFVGAIGEELGWMGYLADPLQKRMNGLSAALILGTSTGAWHVIPFYVMGRSISWISAQVLTIILARIIIVWLYNNSNRSVFICIIFHTSINVTFSLFPNQGSHYNPTITAFVLTIIVVGLGLSIYANNLRSVVTQKV